MALAWKTSEWTLLHTIVLDRRMMVAQLQKDNFILKVVIAHFHHKHKLHFEQCNCLKGELGGPVVIKLADHNSLIIKGRDAYRPLQFENPTALTARELETQALSQQGLRDVWSEVDDLSAFDGTSTEHGMAVF